MDGVDRTLLSAIAVSTRSRSSQANLIEMPQLLEISRGTGINLTAARHAAALFAAQCSRVLTSI